MAAEEDAVAVVLAAVEEEVVEKVDEVAVQITTTIPRRMIASRRKIAKRSQRTINRNTTETTRREAVDEDVGEGHREDVEVEEEVVGGDHVEEAVAEVAERVVEEGITQRMGGRPALRPPTLKNLKRRPRTERTSQTKQKVLIRSSKIGPQLMKRKGRIRLQKIQWFLLLNRTRRKHNFLCRLHPKPSVDAEVYQ